MALRQLLLFITIAAAAVEMAATAAAAVGTAAAAAVGTAAEEAQLERCEQLTAPLLTDHTMLVPINDQQLARLCHTWRLLALCVRRLVSEDGPGPGARLEQFARAVEAAYRSANLLCSDPDYKAAYLSHAPCIRRLATERHLCGGHYSGAVRAAAGPPGPTRRLCCEYGNFRTCMSGAAARGCDETSDLSQLQRLVESTLNSTLQTVHQQCQPLRNQKDACLEDEDQSRPSGNFERPRKADGEPQRHPDGSSRWRPGTERSDGFDVNVRRHMHDQRPLFIMDDPTDRYRYAVSRRFDSKPRWTDIPSGSLDRPQSFRHEDGWQQNSRRHHGDDATSLGEWRDPIVVYSGVIRERERGRPWRADATTARPARDGDSWRDRPDTDGGQAGEDRRELRNDRYHLTTKSDTNTHFRPSENIQLEIASRDPENWRNMKERRLDDDEFHFDDQSDRNRYRNSEWQKQLGNNDRDQANGSPIPKATSRPLSDQYLTIHRGHLDIPRVNLYDLPSNRPELREQPGSDHQPSEEQYNTENTDSENDVEYSDSIATFDNVNNAPQASSSFSIDTKEQMGQQDTLDNNADFSYTHQILDKHEQEKELPQKLDSTAHPLKYTQLESQDGKDLSPDNAQQSYDSSILDDPPQRQAQAINSLDFPTPAPAARTTTAYSGWFRTRMPDARIWSNVAGGEAGHAYAAPHRSSAPAARCSHCSGRLVALVISCLLATVF